MRPVWFEISGSRLGIEAAKRRQCESRCDLHRRFEVERMRPDAEIIPVPAVIKPQDPPAADKCVGLKAQWDLQPVEGQVFHLRSYIIIEKNPVKRRAKQSLLIDHGRIKTNGKPLIDNLV